MKGVVGVVAWGGEAALGIGGAAVVAAALTALGAPSWPAGAIGAAVGVAAIATAASPLPRRGEIASARRERATGAMAPGVGRALLDRLPLGMLLIDAGGRIAYQNPAADDILERRVAGMQWTVALRAPALTEAIAAAFEDARSSEVDLTLVRGNERVIHASVVALPTQDDDPAPHPRPAVLVLMEDRTRMAKAEALRRDFVANASHELKTPLASISGFIETLQGHARNDPEATERFLAIMAKQSERMKRLVEDLLSLNRIEINEHVRPRDIVDVGALVWEVASGLGPLVAAEGATVTVELPREGPVIQGSRDELAQVFVNLIDNAVKYAGREGPIRVHLADAALAPRPGMLGVTVADNGPGIPREHLPRLTERFYRVNAARSRERGGTGLGLAIAKHIVNRHRGDLTIASAPGEGSRFTVWFPATKAERRAA